MECMSKEAPQDSPNHSTVPSTTRVLAGSEPRQALRLPTRDQSHLVDGVVVP